MSKQGRLDNKQLRAIGHKLKPVVTVAGEGLSEGVMAELEREIEIYDRAGDEVAVAFFLARRVPIPE